MARNITTDMVTEYVEKRFDADDSTLASLGRSLGIRPERLPTNTTANSHAVHRWFNFIAGFSPEYVANCCTNLRSGDILLDPFAGCGTALVVAQQLGLDAIGFDPHPFFSTIATAKVSSPVENRAVLDQLESALLRGARSPVSAASALSDSPRAFLNKLFDEDKLEQLLGCREVLMGGALANEPLAFLVLSRVVDLCSRSQTDGIYKAPSSAKKAAEPSAAIRQTVSQIRADLNCLQGDRGKAQVFAQSSEHMRSVQSDSVAVVVTSPPYLNNFDFAEMTRMYLYFWGTCASWKEITEKVRAPLIVNTTTALAGHRGAQQEYRSEVIEPVRVELDAVVAELSAARLEKAGTKEYDLLVYPYFAQMSRVLAECLRCLRAGGRFHMVVSDAALYGVHIAAPQFLSIIAADLGFRDVECAKIRSRGHRWVLSKRSGSPIGLGEYQIVGRK